MFVFFFKSKLHISYVKANDHRRDGVRPPLKAGSGFLRGVLSQLKKFRLELWRSTDPEDQRRYPGKSGFSN